MESTFPQLLLQGSQPQWDCKAMLEQACPGSNSGYSSAYTSPDPGYYGTCPGSDAGHCLNSDSGYYSACPSSDPGYYSTCGSLSPASSVDSGCFSPPPLLCAATDCSTLPGAIPQVTEAAVPQPPRTHSGRRSRSKYPGKKRQSASEREKLRMRGLAKALHHLRTYLPPSVVPAGQTLTKIETLRLAIRYIAHLSDLLQHSEKDELQGCTMNCSPPLTDPLDLQSSFHPTTDSLMTESISPLQPGFPHLSNHFTPSLSHQLQRSSCRGRAVSHVTEVTALQLSK
ncbi:hypothetical protein JZ751_020354 [Albula glossodonta]|uniref:BHLH domain-containing protein n=1 Tax=Albula glossodonta TaxID=121402 RepID=A0A8T2NT17_9TELE|nr:hypothetical protein JZ751_020354 [Albula glossodonta]